MNSATPAASESRPSRSDTDALTGQLSLPGSPSAAANPTADQVAGIGDVDPADTASGDDDEYEPV